MSRECYFASDARLGGKENPYVKLFSIREALDFGVNLDMNLLESINPDEPGVIAWCENEDMFDYPNIWISEPFRQAPKSKKKYYAEMGGNPLLDLPGIIAYIHENLKKKKNGEHTKELELWYVWLPCDEKDVVEKTCSLKNLTEDVLREVFADDDLDYKLTIVR